MTLDRRLAALEASAAEREAASLPVMGDTEARRHLEFFAYLGGGGPSEPPAIGLARLAGVPDALVALRSDADCFAAKVKAPLEPIQGLAGDALASAIRRSGRFT